MFPSLSSHPDLRGTCAGAKHEATHLHRQNTAMGNISVKRNA